MKKFASVLLAVLVAFSMFSFVVSAAGAKIAVSADKTDVKVGDKVVVTVKLDEKSGLGVLTVKANYDSSVLKATDMKAGDLGATVNVKTGVATMAAAETFEAAGVVCTMTFEAVKAGTVDVKFDVVEACDKDFNTVTVEANSVKVTVAEAAEEPTEKPSETPSEKPSEEPTECKHETMSNWATTEPTCKKDGFKVRNCTVCGYEEKEAIPATGKCENKWVTVKQPTATTKGLQELKCTMCGAVSATRETALADTNNNAGDSLDKPAIPNTDAIA